MLNLRRKLEGQDALSLLFISHDLSVGRYMAGTIAVIYLGKMVEVGRAEDICAAPGHPYTRALINAVPVIVGSPADELTRAGSDPWQGQAPTLPPDPAQPPSGCRFRFRCPLAQDICAAQEPPLRPHPDTRQLVACHFPLLSADPERAG